MLITFVNHPSINAEKISMLKKLAPNPVMLLLLLNSCSTPLPDDVSQMTGDEKERYCVRERGSASQNCQAFSTNQGLVSTCQKRKKDAIANIELHCAL